MPEVQHKSGFVALVGRPNVGKSTLVNALLGQKIAAVSPRPQTTRRRQLGILTSEDAQVVLVDTPGMHIAHHKLGEAMNQAAAEALEDADVVIWLVDVSEPPTEEDLLIARRLSALMPQPKMILALNKVDQLQGSKTPERRAAYLDLLPGAYPMELAASLHRGVTTLLTQVMEWLPEGPPYYEAEQITDLFERDIAADLVREAALIHLRDEVPHSIAVRIDEFTERGDTGGYIEATIFVERESQKGIVIGKGGEMLKKIGTTARKEIEGMSGRKVFLELRVKVNANWRDNPQALRSFGYAEESNHK